VRIIGPGFVPDNKSNLCIKTIKKTVLMFGKNTEEIASVPCGNIVGLLGVDVLIAKNSTISTHSQACALRKMKFTVSPIVSVVVRPQHPAALPQMVEGLEKLNKSDLSVVCNISETGEYYIFGCGELHLEICVSDLSEFTGVEITQDEPDVVYKETVQAKSSQVCLAKKG
jgi:elongation factor 2